MNELPESIDVSKAVPWGFWATIGFSSVVLAALFITQLVVSFVFGFFALQNPQIDLQTFSSSLPFNGFYLAIAIIVSATICAGLTLLFAKLRKDIPIKEYLGLRKPTNRQLVSWLALLGIFLVFSIAFSYLSNYPIVSDFMVTVYKTAYFLPAFYLALLFMAPVFEEVFIRGFLFEGIRCSRLRSIGAVVLTTLVWTILHIQYHPRVLIEIFFFGLLLGIARHKTGSTYLTMAMHSLNNLVAIVLVAVLAGCGEIKDVYSDRYIEEDFKYVNDTIGFSITFKDWEVYPHISSMPKGAQKFAKSLRDQGAELIFVANSSNRLLTARATVEEMNLPLHQYYNLIYDINREQLEEGVSKDMITVGKTDMVKWIYKAAKSFTDQEYQVKKDKYNIRLSFWTTRSLFDDYKDDFHEIASTFRTTDN